MSRPSRRDFVKRALLVTAGVPLTGIAASPSAVTAASAEPREGRSGSGGRYLTLRAAEAAFVERLAVVLCPADGLTPDGVACGIPAALDHTLDGAFGRRPSRVPPLTERQLFAAGVLAIDDASRARWGRRFVDLTSAEGRGWLRDISREERTGETISAGWAYQEVVRAHLCRACFSNPLYDAYSNRVFWKLFA